MSGPGILTSTDLSEPPKQDTILDEAQSQGCPDNLKTVSCNPSVRHEHPDQPLHGLSLASHAVLEKAQQRGRVKCSKCGGSRMFFCYTCCSLVGVSHIEIPSVKLPVKIDIIKHPSEVDGKSTAVHAKILAPDDVTIYTYPCIPEFEGEKHKVVLVFPGPGSVSMEDMKQRLRHMAGRRSADSPEEPHPKRLRCGKTPAEEPRLGAPHVAEGPGSGAGPLLRVVFIDSTWNQTNRIITDERLQALLQVELKTRKTCFWRHQKGSPDTYLATIEAIYYFLKDYHEQCLSQEYRGEYDNLLFFYSYLHTLITKAKTSAGKL
ncbi:tRNA-uridine aminocarboxypropyltransferase 1 isoform X1 [Osmerus mordax]|uniref:tRNA-uridine aminocarboxypropyltransferase 1 isoform X1 n=1 Tax=Osmerus mordax TaxID=8014 RepID=UPI00351034AC